MALSGGGGVEIMMAANFGVSWQTTDESFQLVWSKLFTSKLFAVKLSGGGRHLALTESPFSFSFPYVGLGESILSLSLSRFPFPPPELYQQAPDGKSELFRIFPIWD